MSDFQTGIRGGQVMVNGELVKTDIWISGGRIAALGDLPGVRADDVIDAEGLVVLPGIIDTHTHTRDPGYTHKEDFLSASQAAAVGGTTSIVDMPNVEPPTDTVEEFLRKRERADQLSIVDWGHWVAGTKPEEIPKLAAAGATGYKIFQVSGAYPHDPRLALNAEADLMASFRAIAETGLPCLVHPFNQSLFERLSEEAWAAGKGKGGATFSEVYTTEAIWQTAIHTLITLQQLTGVRLHLLHTHSAEGLRLIRAAKARGQRVSCEIDPKYYHLTEKDIAEQGGRVVPAGFVTSDEGRMEEIWRSLRDGTIDNISTDHAPHTLEEVLEANTDAWTSNLGCPQLDYLYGLVLTDVHEGKHSLARAVELLSETPAKLTGVWPRKGIIAPGADADLVLVDMDAETTLTDEGLYTKVGWTPYAGRTLRGSVHATVLRGTTIARDRQILVPPGFGQYIQGTPQ
jgi:dihydroorotase (multifunctional complex type)